MNSPATTQVTPSATATARFRPARRAGLAVITGAAAVALALATPSTALILTAHARTGQPLPTITVDSSTSSPPGPATQIPVDPC